MLILLITLTSFLRNEDGLTPVHVAAVWGRTGLLVLLLSCGGDPWIRDTEQGLTPLHLALREKHLETALVLQRYQLVDRRNRYSEGHKPPRFNINFGNFYFICCIFLFIFIFCNNAIVSIIF